MVSTINYLNPFQSQEGRRLVLLVSYLADRVADHWREHHYPLYPDEYSINLIHSSWKPPLLALLPIYNNFPSLNKVPSGNQSINESIIYSTLTG